MKKKYNLGILDFVANFMLNILNFVFISYKAFNSSLSI